MCRALPEAASRDICERLGLIRCSSKSCGGGWSRLLCKAARALGIEEPFKKSLKRLYGDLCTVAHAEREATSRKVLTEFHETLFGFKELHGRLADHARTRRGRRGGRGLFMGYELCRGRHNLHAMHSLPSNCAFNG